MRYLSCILLVACLNLTAQTYTLKGKVTELATGLPITGAVIINRSVNNGVYSDGRGYFTIKAQKSDTLVISMISFQQQKLCYADSAGTEFLLEIKLPQRIYSTKPVTIRPLKSFEEIERDKRLLGINRIPTLRTTDALQSPITALYEQFSRFERNRRKVAELRDLEAKKDLIRELLRIYTRTDVIKLDEDEFTDFIDFLNLSEDFLKNATQYEIGYVIKRKYDIYLYRKERQNR